MNPRIFINNLRTIAEDARYSGNYSYISVALHDAIKVIEDQSERISELEEKIANLHDSVFVGYKPDYD